MANLRITHSVVEGGTVDPGAAVDGAAWDAEHVVAGAEQMNNTSDADKPISTAQQAALDLKAPKANPAFTGTVAGAGSATFGSYGNPGATFSVSVKSGEGAGAGGFHYIIKNSKTNAGDGMWLWGHESGILGAGLSNDWVLYANAVGPALRFNSSTTVGTFGATPIAPTAAQNSNSNLLATTAYVDRTTREKATAGRNYFVATTGSDTLNDGLSVGSPFRTIQKAVNVACALDLLIYGCSINVANGTYNETVQIGKMTGGTSLNFYGNTTTPSSVVVNNTAGFGCFNFTQSGTYNIQGFKFTSSGGNAAGMTVFNPGTVVSYGYVEFGNCGTYGIWCNGGGGVYNTGPVTISGPSSFHLLLQQNCFADIRNCVFIFTTNPTNFAGAFLQATYCSSILASSMTYTNKAYATGKYFNVTGNSIVETGGAGLTALPGSIAGTTSTQGLYN